MRIQLARASVVLSLLVCTVAPALAGPYADDMAKCLVKASSDADRVTLAKWIFSLLALNQQVESLANISPEQRDEINKSAGSLFQRLITESCRSETQQAIKYEGQIVLQQAFQAFSQASMTQLATSARVAEGAKAFSKYMDDEKIKAVIGGDSPK